MDRVEELKKLRSSLSCTLSTIRREIKNPLLSKEQLRNKLNRGLKTATRYKETSEQLLKFGLKYEAKAPHMYPEWWEKCKNENINIVVETKEVEHNESHDGEYNECIAAPNIINSIKNTIKDELGDLVKLFKDKTEEKEYELNIAWTNDEKCEDAVNNLISIINDYMKTMNIDTVRSDKYDNECVNIYKYTGTEYANIKKTIQFMIDRWGEETNVSVYGKLCKY